MKILFIGGTGSISTSCSHLLANKGYQLTLITRGNLINRLPSKVHHIKADFNNKNNNLHRFCSNEYWDCVINWNIYNKNQALRDIAIFKQNAKKYIYISTTAVYGDVSHPINEETDVYNKLWDYAVFKLQAEEVFKKACIDEKFPVTILRPGHTYCDFTIPSNIQGLGFGLIEQILNQEMVLMHDEGESNWTLTHSDDFAKILSKIMLRDDINGETFNVVTSENQSWNEIYNLYEKILKVKVKKLNIPSKLIYDYDKKIGMPIVSDKRKNMIFDNSKIYNFIPNYYDFVSTEAGLTRSVKWSMENRSDIYFNIDIKKKIRNIIKLYGNKK